MPNCTVESITPGKLGRRTIETSFDGGDLSSDAGVLLLKRADERIGLTRATLLVCLSRCPRAQQHGSAPLMKYPG